MKKFSFILIIFFAFIGLAKPASATENFLPLNQTSRAWIGIAVDSSNQDVYAAVYGGDIYKQTGGVGDFLPLGQTSRNWTEITVDSSNHNVYALIDMRDIYKQTGGVGNFVAMGIPAARYMHGISVDSSNQNIYASCCFSNSAGPGGVAIGNINKQTGGSGSFVYLGPGQANRPWSGLSVDSSNQNVYGVTRAGASFDDPVNGGVYKQTGGVGDFLSLGQTSRDWTGVSVDRSNQHVYAVVNGGDVYKQTSGVGDFLPLGQTSRAWSGVSVDSSNHNVYAAVNGGDIYKMTAAGDPGPGFGAVTSTQEIWLIFQGGQGATSYNIYRSVGVNDFSQAVKIGDNIPAVYPANPLQASLPDAAIFNDKWTANSATFPAGYQGNYFSYDDLTASTNDFNYYWVQSVGAGTGALVPAFTYGIKAVGLPAGPEIMFSGNAGSGTTTTPWPDADPATMTVPYNGSLDLYWTVYPALTSCSASGAWSGNLPLYYDWNSLGFVYTGYHEISRAKSLVYGLQTIPNITSDGTYTITCTGPTDVDGNTANLSRTINVDVGLPPAVVDIKADGSDTDITILYNTDVDLSWSYSGATSCSITAPASISLPPPAGSGSISTGNLTASRTYSISCDGNEDDVVVNVSPGTGPFTLHLSKFGQGIVESDPDGVICDQACSSQSVLFDGGAEVNLTVDAAPTGRIFSGWGGDCASFGANTVCTLTMDGDKNVTAIFSANPKFQEF